MQVFIGFIAIFGFNFAPSGWALCNGQLLSISANSALFALLGTTYGGDGLSTFAVPNLQGRVPIGMGTGPGLSPYAIGQQSGTENVTLLTSNLPSHNHQMMASADGSSSNVASGASLGSNARGGAMPNIYVPGATNQVPMASATSVAGNNIPVSIIQPFLAINFSIAVEGIFPSRN